LLTQTTSLKNLAYFNIRLPLLLVVCLLFSCSTPKDTAMSRGMQNLTARYNYIYNSNVLLENYEEQLHDTYVDNFNEILPVFTDPEKFSFTESSAAPVTDKNLDKIITKAQAIIADKAFSNYIDDAYMLVGKAHYLKTNYFIAEEYFDYTAKTYTANLPMANNALTWKAKSLMQLDNIKDAALVLDTVYANLPSLNNNKSEALATLAQLCIYQRKYNEAILLLNNAIKTEDLKRKRIRWTYILAQLYERQKDYAEALTKYLKVQNSNAGFELFFNANLNRIRLSGMLTGQKVNRQQQLLSLLKDDKNLDYVDQIYYQIAESYMDEANYPAAEKYYNLSVSNSSKNNYQKGTSYLRIADLNFKYQRNFLKAKLYYDSTLSTLPKTYPGYAQIEKKNENLEYLSKRYEMIAYEDTLQVIAKLPLAERITRIKLIAAPAVLPFSAKDNNGSGNPASAQKNNSNNTGTFYFSNSTAMRKGAADFITRWGNRKLEDDWRVSRKSSAQQTTENIAKAQNNGLPTVSTGDSVGRQGQDTTVSKYLAAVPVTPAQVSASNQKIVDAYYEIANFYQQELEDQDEASKIYQLILSRFPDNNRLASIYYSLYLGYKNNDPENTAKYRKLVLEQFPTSVYAKTILDPDYSAKQSEKEARVLASYNEVFAQYERKAFPTVITAVNTTVSEYPDNAMNPQLNYLKAIAIGRTQNIDSLVSAFKAITNSYPDDKLIVPLVKNHLEYIAAHRAEFASRKIALPDFDANEPRFFALQPIPQKQAVAEPAPVPVAEKSVPVVENVPKKAVPEETPVSANNIFSTALSTVYYFVIDVEDATLTLSSSRFGIGQFNRGNYAGTGLRHQLTEFDNDQLIYVGNFSSFAQAKSYADEINPQLGQIMKVPAGIYSSFIISKENFEKLQRKDLVTKYLEFYKNNYQK